MQCIPYERLQSLLKTIFNIEMGQGTISNIIQSTRKKAVPAIELIKDHICQSSVVGFDESGCYCNGAWIGLGLHRLLITHSFFGLPPGLGKFLKISGTFRSDKGADTFMAVHSIADTAWKNKQSPFEAILALY